MSTAVSSLVYEWKDLPWRDIERKVFKLQKRIYQAGQHGNKVAVHKLQKLLLSSWQAKCLAVRKVTQDNKGKKTAGVDGKLALSPKHRMRLVQNLNLKPKSTPVRRVWIPKPGSDEKRPLGIPTIENRAQQALAKMALEPEWEARFEPNSYGFRPGRSAHDAIEAVQNSVKYKHKFVLDADIAKCFDRINHQALLEKLGTFSVMRRAVKTWLKAKIMDGDELFPSEEGTPQGGVISPLLANIALHGLETALTSAFPKNITLNGKGIGRYQPRVIRYADDFVVLHPDLKVVEKATRIAQEWLSGMGLELKPSKTRITHTFTKHEGNVGFNFLGFHVRQFKVGKCNYRTSGFSRILVDFKAIIKPSKESVARHYRQMAEVIERNKSAEQANLIRLLNPKIVGWSNYYSTVVSKSIFSKLDHLVTKKLLRWAKRRHQNKSRRKTVNKYWVFSENGRGWVFQASDKSILRWYADVPIKRHAQVAGTKSPFDGNWAYWSKRLQHYPLLTTRQTKLLKMQDGKCRWCKLYFKLGDRIEIDHRIPRRYSGRDEYRNLQLLHVHCHDEKTTIDGSNDPIGQHSIDDNDHVIEEPCEVESLKHGFEDEAFGRPDVLV
jgi:RNA-directed DNA polymerase